MRIKWLHLSDIHFNYKSYNSELLRKDFLHRVKDLNKSEQFTHLFLTGDILFRNQKANEDTISFIRKLVETLELPLDRVFLVPGNHDHDRNQTIDILRYCSSNGEKEINDCIVDNLTQAQKSGLLSTFRNFNDFYKDIFQTDFYKETTKPHIIKYDHHSDLVVVNLNTAWLDQQSEESGELYCGSWALQRLLSENEKKLFENTCIAVGHHPLNDLSSEERERILDLFSRYNIGLYFCGHRHKPSIDYFNDKKLVQVTAPGGYNDGYSEGGYVWGIIDTNLDFYMAEVFSWNKGEWSIESRIPGTNERGIFYFNSDRYKHNSEIVAVDVKLYNGHIPRAELEQALSCQIFDIHTYSERNIFNWKENENSVVSLSDDIKFLVERGKQVHLFPIAPIPTLIKLGFELQQDSKLFIHQYDRQKYEWVYDGDEKIEIKHEMPKQINNHLAVAISTSNLVDQKLIKEAMQRVSYDTLCFVATQIDFGLPLYRKTINEFAVTICSELRKCATKYDSIHLFTAIPAGLAIEIGRRLLKSVFCNVYTYQFSNGRYEQAYVLNE